MHSVKNPPAIIKTNTDEFYFPSRLIYRIESASSVLNTLEKLRCVSKHPTQERWLIECNHEALEIHGWNELYTKAIRHQDPIIIGIIKFTGRSSMQVYARAFGRVTPLLKLIDKFVSRRVAFATHHDVCFKLMTAHQKDEQVTPEDVFADESKIHYSENLRQVDQWEEKTRQTGKDYSRQIKALFDKEFRETASHQSCIQDLERKRLEVFYADGAEEYSRMMQMQEMMALARYFAGGQLNPLKFFEQLFENNGKPITDFQAFLNGSR